jgi:hypothetical protein
LAHRINPNGGLVHIKTNPNSIYSSFKHPDYLGFLLKVHRAVSVIKLNDGSSMVVRDISLLKDTKEEYNEKATKLLHEKSNQKSAIVYGPAIIVEKGDWDA